MTKPIESTPPKPAHIDTTAQVVIRAEDQVRPASEAQVLEQPLSDRKGFELFWLSTGIGDSDWRAKRNAESAWKAALQWADFVKGAKK